MFVDFLSNTPTAPMLNLLIVVIGTGANMRVIDGTTRSSLYRVNATRFLTGMMFVGLFLLSLIPYFNNSLSVKIFLSAASAIIFYSYLLFRLRSGLGLLGNRRLRAVMRMGFGLVALAISFTSLDAAWVPLLFATVISLIQFAKQLRALEQAHEENRSLRQKMLALSARLHQQEQLTAISNSSESLTQHLPHAS